MLNFLCAESANGWYLPVIMLVVVVLIGCVSYIPQRKRKKEYMQMINSVRAGKIIKTAGGFIGEIVSMDEKNGTFELNVGTKENPVIVVLVKGAIAEVMNPDPPTTAAPKQEVQANGEVLPTAVTADDAERDNEIAKKNAEKKAKKEAKKKEKADKKQTENVEAEQVEGEVSNEVVEESEHIVEH